MVARPSGQVGVPRRPKRCRRRCAASSSISSCAPTTSPGPRSDFSGVAYDEDGLLVDGRLAKAEAHLVGAIRGLGYEIVFEGPGAGVTEVIRRIVRGTWSKDEIGEHQFIGRLFGERGQIYRGCTVFDAARYTLRRLAAVGGKLCSGHQS